MIMCRELTDEEIVTVALDFVMDFDHRFMIAFARELFKVAAVQQTITRPEKE